MPGPRGQRKRAERISGGRYQLQCFENTWPEWFFDHHNLTGKDDVPAVEAKKRIGGVEDKLEIFLQVSDGFGSPCEADEVKRYCEGGASLEDVQCGIGEAGTRLAAWIDDRNSPHLTGIGRVRLCRKLLAATGFMRYMKQPRYKHGDEPDAERRLIYIADLTPDMILALAVTAPFLQVPALRDAICKHISFRPSVRVHVPSDGMLNFQLEFHLPFFALRKSQASNCPPPRARGKQLRDWEDLILLTRNKESEGQEKYRLHQAHISCVIQGFDEWQWVAYAFEDTQHEPEDDVNEFDGGELENDEAISCQGIDEDPITCGLDADKPIWRPRQYFLKAFEMQIRKFREEWDELVHRLEVDRSEYIRLHPNPSSKSSRNSNERAEEMNTSFDWTRRRRDLLNKLLVVLSGIIREWDTFISSDGDVGYFSDLDEFPTNSPEFHQSGHAAQSLRNIKQAFERLEDDRQRLISLKESFSSDFSTLKLLLSLEGNDATANSAFLSKFTIWVLCPCSLAAGFFSMQPTVIPVDLTFRWFLTTVLILMVMMLVVQWLMMRWSSWRDEIVLWWKLKGLEAEVEKARPGLASEDQNDAIPDFHQYGTESDLESLGARVLLGRRMY